MNPDPARTRDDAHQWEEDFSLVSRAMVLIVMDHARAGNNFFVRIFDQHPQILTVPFNPYFYSSVLSALGRDKRVPGAAAYHFLTRTANFSLVAQDMTREIAQEFVRMGDDPEGKIDRERVRAVLSALLEKKTRVSRKDILVAMHVAYAHGIGRDVAPVRYLLINDSVVARSRAVLEAVRADHDAYRLIHLVRDPRANFASLRHQYVNQYDAMYPLSRLKTGEEWSVWLWILQQVTQGSLELYTWREELGPERFYVVRNEDINLRFEPTLRGLTAWLGAEFYRPWASPDFVPTSNGRPWRSISAYSNTYQPNTRGPLANEPPGRVHLPGPNQEVTERWKNELSQREIGFIEAIHLEEMQALGYEPLVFTGDRSSRHALLLALLPLRGEIPRLEWFRPRGGKLFKRLAHLALLPLAYVSSRLRLLRLLRSGALRTRPQGWSDDLETPRGMQDMKGPCERS